ncbi:MAG: hypothetical protein QOE70_6367 [Chthoniobacter sp.]|jgi:integrase|nr:hypothetical protein [Chthoniobacter sp.]
MSKKTTSAEVKKESPWERTKFQYLIRYKPSGVYFAKFKVGKKQFRFSLETTVITVAQARLTERMKEKRAAVPTKNLGRMLVKDAIATYRQQFQSNTRLKPGTKDYYEEVLVMLGKTWPGLEETEVTKITPAQVREWGVKLAKTFSPTRFNNALSAMRHILDITVKAGARHNNPAKDVKRMRQRAKKLALPSREQFGQFVKAIETAGGRFSHHCADFVSFLAFTGMRKGEAAMVAWKDVNFDKGIITVRGDEETGTKNWDVRRVPMIPQAKELLLRMRAKVKDEPATAKVLKVNESQKAIDRAAKAAGMERITHHDLRHFFATICIESGVDIPTVSRWLGHKDGGALLMKTYGHLRDEHSSTQALKVSF